MDEKDFSPEELERYSRQLVLSEVGVEGQLTLKAGRVLIVGAGGLGSPCAFYLGAAGVGRIGIVDFDRVSASNLQRQILYRSDDVGRPKATLAWERLSAMNPEIEVVTHPERLDSRNAPDIIPQYDVVVDCTDNFPTRYLINDTCVLCGKANVYGSVFRFEGQVSVFDPQSGPCYRCLYPMPPPRDLVQDCAQSGVLGVLPGIVGTLQANEVLKLILKIGKPLKGRLLLIDGLTSRIHEVTVPRNPECPACGANPTIHSLIDYDAFCSAERSESVHGPKTEDSEITVGELKRRIDCGERVALLDVREPYEYRICNLGGLLIPLGELERRKSELDPVGELIVYCHHGIRSNVAMMVLRRWGIRRVRNLLGGIDAWARQVDPSMPRY